MVLPVNKGKAIFPFAAITMQNNLAAELICGRYMASIIPRAVIFLADFRQTNIRRRIRRSAAAEGFINTLLYITQDICHATNKSHTTARTYYYSRLSDISWTVAASSAHLTVGLQYSTSEEKLWNFFSSSLLTVGRCAHIACRKSSTQTGLERT